MVHPRQEDGDDYLSYTITLQFSYPYLFRILSSSSMRSAMGTEKNKIQEIGCDATTVLIFSFTSSGETIQTVKTKSSLEIPRDNMLEEF